MAAFHSAHLAAFDRPLTGDDATRWATDAEVSKCWLEADLGKPETFNRAMIDECTDYGVRVKSFELQYRNGGDWVTFFKGTTMGKDNEVKFDPVTAQHVRLNIEGQGGPTINEFQLFAPAKPKALQRRERFLRQRLEKKGVKAIL
jgi:hypothetical protein